MASAAFMHPPLERTYSGMDAPSVTMMEALVNQKAGSYSSLYQSCLSLRRRLAEVPGMETYLKDMDTEEQDSGDESDIVTSTWNMLRRGDPLMMLFNALRPPVPLSLNALPVAESKRGKAATFKFLQACMTELKFPAAECFLITDLYGTNTTGFVKVLKVIDRVLDLLERNGLLLRTAGFQNVNGDSAEPKVLNALGNIIKEIVTTERDYVQHLDTLQQFKDELERSGVIPGDMVHDIFMNLNALVDHQRRFLIRVEQQNCLDPAMQNWGRLFCQYAEGFVIYETFIGNQARSSETIIQQWSKIKSANVSQGLQGMLESNTLSSFLLKPMQRITKYPLLLDQLIKRGGYSDNEKQDLAKGKAAITEILALCNAAADKAERLQKVINLGESVDDWKGHRLDHFGELVISGQHTVLKGDTLKAEEREYKIYLFERILLCCKELNMSKPKNRLGGKTVPKSGKPRLQLKGRIFIQNITDICKHEETRMPTKKPYFLKVFWRGEPGLENFNVCFGDAATRDDWFNLATAQREKFPKSRDYTSTTQFTSLENQNLQNPYHEPLDDIEDDEEPRLSNSSTLVSSNHTDYSISKNASSASLRSRSTTGGSDPRVPATSAAGPPAARPSRFPLPDPSYPAMNPPSLRLATNMTPDERVQGSYFSPITESPSSSSIRSSSQSGSITPVYSNRGQPTPTNGFRPYEGSKHNTAPPGTYQERQHQRPPPSTSAMYGPQSQNRQRSLSSGDIHQQSNSPGKRYMNGSATPGPDDVPVPPIPSHLTRNPINRSQTNSPTENPRYVRSQTPGGYGYSQVYNNRDPHSRSNSRQGHNYVGSAPTSHGIGQRVASPAVTQSYMNNFMQVKVKIYYEARSERNHATIIVTTREIKYQSLIDRIDAKMQRIFPNTTPTIAGGTARIRYLDEDGTQVTIENDEDVEIALDEWKKTQNHEDIANGNASDLELFWVPKEKSFRSR